MTDALFDTSPEIELTTIPEDETIRACVLIIGNEILSGRTQDLNVKFLAENLANHGILLKEVRMIPDDELSIIHHIHDVKHRFKYIFTTGGIGPTHDDITSHSIAKALNLDFIEHPEAVERLERHYRGELTLGRRRMAMMPEGSILIDHPATGAPGFRIENIYVLAGVPSIMRGMVMSLLPTLKGGKPPLQQSISCMLGESDIASDLEKIQEKYPSLEIGSYPFFRPEGWGTVLVVRGLDKRSIERAIGRIRTMIESHGGQAAEDTDLLFQHISHKKEDLEDNHLDFYQKRALLSHERSTFSLIRNWLAVIRVRNLVTTVAVMGLLLVGGLTLISGGPRIKTIQKSLSPTFQTHNPQIMLPSTR